MIVISCQQACKMERLFVVGWDYGTHGTHGTYDYGTMGQHPLSVEPPCIPHTTHYAPGFADALRVFLT